MDITRKEGDLSGTVHDDLPDRDAGGLAQLVLTIGAAVHDDSVRVHAGDERRRELATRADGKVCSLLGNPSSDGGGQQRLGGIGDSNAR